MWRAVDERLGRTVAIKLMHPHLVSDPDTATRFRREAVAAAVSHPHAVLVYDIGQQENQLYLVMEHIDGPTLADAVRMHGRLDPPVVAAIGQQVASALAAAHQRGIVHRDVKPANILLDRHGNAKIGDFGIAKALGAAEAGLTKPGTVMGTAAYVAPEQLSGDEVGPAADVYALGLVLHQCLTGESPFGSGTIPEVAARRLTVEVEPPRRARPEIPAPLDAAITRATQREAGRRFTDASELAAALRVSAASEPNAAVTALLPADGDEHPPAAAAAHPRTPGPAAAVRVPAARRHPGTAGPQPSGAPGHGQPGTGPGPEENTAPIDRGAVAAAAGHAGPGGDGAPGWRRWSAVAAAAALLAGAAATATLLSSRTTEQEPPATVPAAPQPLRVVEAGDFDPFGGGGEHPEEVGALFDGDPATTWSTERYTRADLGGLKPGVGVWLDLGEVAGPSEVEVDLATPGIDLRLYAFDRWPPADTDPEGWGAPAATAQRASTTVRLPVSPEVRGRYWLVWITSLVPSEGGYRAGIREVRFDA